MDDNRMVFKENQGAKFAAITFLLTALAIVFIGYKFSVFTAHTYYLLKTAIIVLIIISSLTFFFRKCIVLTKEGITFEYYRKKVFVLFPDIQQVRIIERRSHTMYWRMTIALIMEIELKNAAIYTLPITDYIDMQLLINQLEDYLGKDSVINPLRPFSKRLFGNYS